jgi:hypothetical protein
MLQLNFKKNFYAITFGLHVLRKIKWADVTLLVFKFLYRGRLCFSN